MVQCWALLSFDRFDGGAADSASACILYICSSLHHCFYYTDYKKQMTLYNRAQCLLVKIDGRYVWDVIRDIGWSQQLGVARLCVKGSEQEKEGGPLRGSLGGRQQVHAPSLWCGVGCEARELIWPRCCKDLSTSAPKPRATQTKPRTRQLSHSAPPRTQNTPPPPPTTHAHQRTHPPTHDAPLRC